MIESRELGDADLRKPSPPFGPRKKAVNDYANSPGEGEHANGPYWMRV